MQDVTSGGFLFYVFECDIANGRGKALRLFLALKLNKLAGDLVSSLFNVFLHARSVAESSGLKRLFPDKLVK